VEHGENLHVLRLDQVKNKKNKPLKPAPGAEGAGGRGASGEVATSARVGRTGWPVRLSRPEGRRMPGAAGRAEVHYTPSAS